MALLLRKKVEDGVSFLLAMKPGFSNLFFNFASLPSPLSLILFPVRGLCCIHTSISASCCQPPQGTQSSLLGQPGGDSVTGQGWQEGCYFCLMTSSLNYLQSILIIQVPFQLWGHGGRTGQASSCRLPLLKHYGEKKGIQTSKCLKQGKEKGWETPVQCWIVPLPTPLCTQT